MFFFFNDTATTEIYTLSLHDALPIWGSPRGYFGARAAGMLDSVGATAWLLLPCSQCVCAECAGRPMSEDRKSTRLNSSHSQISYAVFCLKKKKTQQPSRLTPSELPRF